MLLRLTAGNVLPLVALTFPSVLRFPLLLNSRVEGYQSASSTSAAHLGMVSAFHSSSCISSFTPRIFSFTPMGSGDTILCADHPILGQAVIVLHLDYPNCYESQDAFSSGHVERTSLPHRSDVSLGVMGRHPPTCKSSRYVQET